jgi:copper transport protein
VGSGPWFYILRTAVAWRHQPGLVRAAIGAYVRPAIWIVVAVTATGLGATLLLVPLDQVTTTDYGRILTIRTILLAGAAGLALLARHHLRRTAIPGRIRCPARLEAIALCGILVLSALLTLVPQPASAETALQPPATGPCRVGRGPGPGRSDIRTPRRIGDEVNRRPPHAS